MGTRKLWFECTALYHSANAAIFLMRFMPLLNVWLRWAWLKRHDEVQSVTFAAAGFRSNRKSHAEFERMVLTIAGVAK